MSLLFPFVSVAGKFKKILSVRFFSEHPLPISVQIPIKLKFGLSLAIKKSLGTFLVGNSMKIKTTYNYLTPLVYILQWIGQIQGFFFSSDFLGMQLSTRDFLWDIFYSIELKNCS